MILIIVLWSAMCRGSFWDKRMPWLGLLGGGQLWLLAQHSAHSLDSHWRAWPPEQGNYPVMDEHFWYTFSHTHTLILSLIHTHIHTHTEWMIMALKHNDHTLNHHFLPSASGKSTLREILQVATCLSSTGSCHVIQILIYVCSQLQR